MSRQKMGVSGPLQLDHPGKKEREIDGIGAKREVKGGEISGMGGEEEEERSRDEREIGGMGAEREAKC